jgi:hypothetical protein
MTKIKNFPIVKDAWKLSKNDMLVYLVLFHEHNIEIEIKNELLISRHIFDDKLLINILWRIASDLPPDILNQKMSGLLSLKSKSVLICKNYEIESYTNEPLIPTENINKLFNYIIRNSDYVTKEDCYDLEYNVLEPANIENSTFETLLLDIQKLIEFEEYYKLRKIDLP